MIVSKDVSTVTTNLHHRAARFMENKPLETPQCSDYNMQKNLHEVRANQLRLEMQLEELLSAHLEICTGFK